MVVCQYFLRGTCKFGNNCRNEHTKGEFGQPAFGQSRSDRYHFNAAKTTGFGANNTSVFGTKVNQTEQNGIIQLLRKDLQDWDTCKIWPLSCFAAQKEQKCLPGLQDTSPEELRIEAYKCIATGQLQPYLDGLTSLSNQTMTRRNQLKTMTNHQLTEEINAAVSTQSSSSSGLFSNQSTTGLFSSSTQHRPGGLFSANSTSTDLFGSGSQNKSTGLFSSSVHSTSTGHFGSTQSTSGLFGSSSHIGGLFGSSSNAPVNPFISATTNSTSGFGSGKPSTGALFSNNTGSGLFSNNSGGGLFSSNNISPNGFGTSNPAPLPTPFGSNTSISNPFGNSTVNTGLFSSSQTARGGGLFSSPQKPSGGGLFSSSQQSSSGGFLGATQTSSAVSLLNASNTTGAASFGVSSDISVISTEMIDQIQSSSGPVNPFFTQSYKTKQQQQLQQYDQLKQQQPAVAVQSIVKIPEVTPEDLVKFKTDKFILGQIPTCPPPPELCT